MEFCRRDGTFQASALRQASEVSDMDELLRRLQLLFVPPPLRVAVAVMASSGFGAPHRTERAGHKMLGPVGDIPSGQPRQVAASSQEPSASRPPAITELDLLRAFGCDV
jgi:hypothetical protein